MTGFTYEYTNGYINGFTEIRLIKVYNDGVYYFKDWVELGGPSSETDWENRAEQILLIVTWVPETCEPAVTLNKSKVKGPIVPVPTNLNAMCVAVTVDAGEKEVPICVGVVVTA